MFILVNNMYLILILILILIILLNFKLYYHESFKNMNDSKPIENNPDECNTFFDKNSYCEYDIDEEICNCKFQKDDVKYIFNSPEPCCIKNCSKFSREKCVDNRNYTKVPYYCNIGGTCKEYEGTIISSHIAANNCGNDPLNNQILLPYASKEACQKSIDPCDKHNIPSRSANINKEECLKDVNCGFCTNDYGGGKCISGTAEGPLDLQKYFFCNVGATVNSNKYTYGNQMEYLLQPANISSFSNENLVNS